MNNQRFSLKGRVALVTGGSKGLGLAMARGLAEAGADLFICSRHENELRSAAQQIADGLPARVEWVVTDLADRKNVRSLAEAALDRFGHVDILINNAGTNCPQPIDEIRDEDWDRLMELNLNSVMALTRALVPQMKSAAGAASFIFPQFWAWRQRRPKFYCATKTALSALPKRPRWTSALQHYVQLHRPRTFLTDLPLSLLTEAQKQQFAQKTALGRWGRPEELAGPALLLASRLAVTLRNGHLGGWRGVVPGL
jgi:NAD(P)-dependent dehydrogenase (short-subunit alcohol dehydrogenase family)